MKMAGGVCILSVGGNELVNMVKGAVAFSRTFAFSVLPPCLYDGLQDFLDLVGF